MKLSKIAVKIFKRFKKATFPDQLERLNKLPRYTPGTFKIRDRYIKFPDAASFISIYKELFEKEIYKFQSTKDDILIIDCGANIGLSIIYFNLLFPKATIIGFEPDKEIYSYLLQNITGLPGAENIQLKNSGVWHENGVVSFQSEGADAGRISNHSESSSTIITEVLSAYINRRVDFLKIDIEGAEIVVIKEIEEKLDFVERLFIEFHSFANAEQELDIILAILRKHKFRYYIESPSKLRNHPYIDRSTYLSFDLLINIYAYRA